jgi:putative membrane protein
VKQFGQKMVQDHQQANEKLQDVARNLGVTPPASLDAKDQKLKDRLSKLSGAQFDKVYMWNMVHDHKQDIAEFQKEAQNGKNDQLKDFAQQTLPTLQEHLKLAEQTKGKAQ